MSRASQGRWMALTVVAYVAVTVVMTWPYVSYRHFATATYGGDQRLIVWTLAWDNRAVLEGLPLFGSNLFFPYPDSLRYNEHLVGVSLFSLPWAAAGASPVLAHNLTWWLAFPLNGLATFALLWRYVRAAIPAFIGSLAFVWSFYVMIHAHAHLHLVWLWPLPLSMLLLERWFDEPRMSRLAPWVLVLLAGVLTSWYMAVLVLLVNGLVFVTLLLTRPEPAGRAKAAGPGARARQLVLAGAFLAAAVFPFARHYVGFRAAPGEAAAFAATLASYLVPPENTLVGQVWTAASLTPKPGAIYGEQTLFVGWIALALGALGLTALVRGRAETRRAWGFVVLVVVGFLLSLGPAPALLGPTFSPFAWLTALPGLEGMRAAARFSVLATLGLAGLAAIGAAALAQGRLARRPTALLCLVPLMLGEWFVVGFPAGTPTPSTIPAIYSTPEVRAARSLVSLPDYTDTPEWFLGGDYLYYSTAHWRPIVNGFGRTVPDGYGAILDELRGFPDTAAALRARGVQYVIVHADRFPNHGQDLLTQAKANPTSRLVRQVDADYLFELVGR